MNYKIEAIKILLDKECILSRYFPLIPFKDELILRFQKEGILTKEDAICRDDILIDVLKDKSLVNLFKLFLNMYEVSEAKLRELDKLNLSQDERKCFKELYLLPGVKETRARLYYLSSLKSLKDIAAKTPEEIICLIDKTIFDKKFDLKAPFVKEVKTHIAVSKVLTEYLI